MEESKRGRGSVQMPGGPTRAHGACVAQSPPLAAAWGSSGHRVAPSTRVSSGLAAPCLEWEPTDSRAGPPRPGGPVANLTQPGRGRERGAAEVRRSSLGTQLPASAPSQWLLSATPHPVSQVGNRLSGAQWLLRALPGSGRCWAEVGSHRAECEGAETDLSLREEAGPPHPR